MLQKLIKVQPDKIRSQLTEMIALMHNNNELLVSHICDMLKSLIISYPLYAEIPDIYEMAKKLIMNNLKVPSVLKFYHFTLMEQKTCNNYVMELYQYSINTLLNDQSLFHQGMVFMIIEEFILLGVIGLDQFPEMIKWIENRFQQDVEVKNYALNLVSTMILIILNNKGDLAVMQQLV